MVVVLFLLAVFLIASGGAALFSGYEILLGDRGLPIMISGAIILAAGVVLVACAMMARQLSRIARQVGEIRTSLSDLRAANLLATARPPRAAELARPALERDEPEEITEEGAALVVPDEPEQRDLPLPVPPAPAPAPVGPAAVRPEEAVRAVEAVRRPEPAHPAEPKPAPAPEPETPADEPGVVGRYSSGGNNYTMYADGSIIADTPTGQHRFGSLDELKVFVSSGGERR